MNSVITYRPEINGLRALAVISVLIYHTKVILSEKVPFLSGGFLGVDVFFVISGYLITLIILREINAGTFTFMDFYKRRAKRILPALFLVLLVSIPLAWWTLFPYNIIAFRDSLIPSIFFYSNYYFMEGTPYFKDPSAFKPLLHTWSLAVEEQYYLIIPIIIILLVKFWRAGVIPVFALLFVLSFAAAFVYEAPKYAGITFYLLPFRLWELMAGGLLAAIELKWGRNTFGKFSYVATALGFLGLLYSFSFVTSKDLHPHLITLIPIASTAAIIWFSSPKDIITKLLSTKLFVGIGLISYSLYLWHYPLFSFGRAADINPLFAEHLPIFLIQILYISLAALLAILSYRFVEQPLRYKKFRARTYALMLAFFCLAIAGFSSAIKPSGLPERLHFKFPAHHANNISYDNRILLHDRWPFSRSKNRQFTDNTKTNVLVIGDSHAEDLFNAFYFNKDIYPNFFFIKYVYRNKHYRRCFHHQANFFNSKTFRDADIIIMTTARLVNKSNCRYGEKLITKIRETTSKRVILFSKHIRFNYPDQKRALRFGRNRHYDTPLDSFLLGQGKLTDEAIEKLERLYHNAMANDWRTEVKEYRNLAKRIGIEFVDITPIQCDFEAKRCEILTDRGKKIYVDSNHWSATAAKYFGKKIFDRGLSPLNANTPPLK